LASWLPAKTKSSVGSQAIATDKISEAQTRARWLNQSARSDIATRRLSEHVGWGLPTKVSAPSKRRDANASPGTLGRTTKSDSESGRSVERQHEIFFDTNESEMVVTQTDPVSHFRSCEQFERRPIYEHQSIAGGDLIAAFKQYNENEPNVVKLINEDYDVISVEPTGCECSLCDENERPEIANIDSPTISSVSLGIC
jgi:hypothetical protein